MTENVLCSSCNIEINEDDAYIVDDKFLCGNCYDSETSSCARCGERVWNDNNSGNDDTPLCYDCYTYHYHDCSRCGRLVADSTAYYTEEDYDDENPYCYSCYDRYEGNKYLRPYGYKPKPIFHGDGNRFFGVELEIDDAGKLERNAEILCRLANIKENNIYVKTDGSLCDGLEIVTHPMTLDYHMNVMEWELLLAQALGLGYKSHQAETCGLHVHVNRSSFSDDYYRQEECIARILYLVERFWQELLRFSRRTQSQLKKWANRYGYKERPAEILDNAKSNFAGRYTCVNLTNEHTIEFRIFRGTLKYNTLIATLQLVNEMCELASSLRDEAVADLSWCDFVERISPDKCPELIAYLKERRLYINEPIEHEEEI